MIPPFESTGYLPPGIHPATLSEIEARFGQSSELRRVQMESIRWMVDLANKAGVTRVILNGSFVTDIIEPNDVDCVLLLPEDLRRDSPVAGELAKGLPFLDITVANVAEFTFFVNRFFALDRKFREKGMVEVIL